LAVVSHSEVGVEHTMERGEWQHSVPVEEDRERGESSIDMWRRCGVLRGRVSPFIGLRQGSKVVGRGGAMA
jgi:hypothetical protein